MPDDINIKSFKQRLLQRQNELLDLEDINNEAAKTVELDQTCVGRLSRMDAMQGQAMSQEVRRRRKIETQKITSALHRIEEGEYGYCIKCDEGIAKQRLEFDPATPLCISCAEKAESP
ncbi:hypothetical protein MNBD_GAMMA26-2264 [hydrothermal vent metagenome]|uniref:Zinc finger DksA/TraR C4-type domain-containing protein n=1 Tax=hydrothermal vent metagenome TaxID=652676 RepID=A0A3B1BCA7_9ZZZZ